MAEGKKKFKVPVLTSEPANKELHLPTDGLPLRFVEYCKHIAECRNVPLEVTLLSALTVAGSAIGGYVKLRMGAYVNNASLQTLIVASSTAGKSAPLDDIIEPLKVIDKELIKRYKEEKTKWDIENKTASNPSKKPKRTQFLPKGETDAAIRAFVMDNERGGLYYADEMMSFFKSLGTRNNVNGCQRLIEIINGSGVKIDLKTEDLDVKNESFLSMLGGLQPELLPNTFKDEHIASGLLPRLLCVTFDKLPYRQKRIPDSAQTAYWDRLVNALRLFGNTKWTFTLTDEATRVLDEEERKFSTFNTDIPESSRRENWYREIAWSKTAVSVYRMVLIAHVLRAIDTNPEHPFNHYPVEPDIIKWAFSCAPYLVGQKMKVFKDVCGQEKPRSDREVIREVAAMVRRKGREVNQTALAEATGIARNNINAYLNKGV
ncbi:MAG: DUF3987 domain-containing protein [Muribaculaceae bacterium]|nr:DUF3987 domain-containing protein [Muribaculaceae bacterium]